MKKFRVIYDQTIKQRVSFLVRAPDANAAFQYVDSGEGGYPKRIKSRNSTYELVAVEEILPPPPDTRTDEQKAADRAKNVAKLQERQRRLGPGK